MQRLAFEVAHAHGGWPKLSFSFYIAIARLCGVRARAVRGEAVQVVPPAAGVRHGLRRLGASKQSCFIVFQRFSVAKRDFEASVVGACEATLVLPTLHEVYEALQAV